jgi:hypothetical protein
MQIVHASTAASKEYAAYEGHGIAKGTEKKKKKCIPLAPS